MKVFNGPDEFVQFLEENDDLQDVIAWGADLVTFHNSVHKGCKCKENVRKQHRDNMYKDLVLTVIAVSRPLQEILKDNLNEDEIIFKLNEEIILQF
tara:strand:+ start:498 stop:785 length:288 start_codon:yes stop_codon:yes gene_type:complete